VVVIHQTDHNETNFKRVKWILLSRGKIRKTVPCDDTKPLISVTGSAPDSTGRDERSTAHSVVRIFKLFGQGTPFLLKPSVHYFYHNKSYQNGSPNE